MKIFISYSHQDEKYKVELLKQLSNLQRKGIIDGWHDRRIKPGEKWDDSIKNALYECEVVLCLISADFMASDYINNIEIKISLERFNKGEIKIIPIILRPCLWSDTEFGQFQALPKNARPLTTWENMDEGLLNIAQGIATIVKEGEPKNKQEKTHNTSTLNNSEENNKMNVDNKGTNIGKQVNIDKVDNLNIN